MPNKPPRSEVCADTIPTELKDLRQWVCWRYILKNEEWTKIPFRANGEPAKTNDPNTWTAFSTALDACRHRKVFDGIGFVFFESDPYCGIDLDNCLKPDQTPKRWATKIMAELTPVGYGEISPSGTGMKYWTRAPFGAGRNATVGDGKIEIYDRTRYFTATGNHGCGDISDGQEIVDWILETYFTMREESVPAPRPVTSHPTQSTDEIIDRIRQSAQSGTFTKLFDGDWSDYRSGNEGASRADQALCSIIAFWTQHTSQIDAIFRQSGLMRPKWDEKHAADGRTYGQLTIDFALANTTEQVKPKHTARKGYKQRRRLNALRRL